MNSGDMVPDKMRIRALNVAINSGEYDRSDIGCRVPFLRFFATSFIVMCVACSLDSSWSFISYFSSAVSFSKVHGDTP